MDEKLRAIFRDVFGISDADYNDKLSAQTLKAWDSVTHLSLLLALEQGFAVSFQPEEATAMTSVAAIKRALADKCVA
jgi:acyl carrier protein